MMRHNSHILIGVLIGVTDIHGGNGLSVALQWTSSSLTNPAPSFLIHAGDFESLSAVDYIV